MSNVKTSVRGLFFLLEDVGTMATHLETLVADKKAGHVLTEAHGIIAAKPAIHTAMNRIAEEFKTLSKTDTSGPAYTSPARQAWESKVAGEMIALFKKVEPHVNGLAAKDTMTTIEAEQGSSGRLTSLSVKNHIKDVLTNELQGMGRDPGAYRHSPFGNYKPKVVPVMPVQAAAAPVATVVADVKKAAPALTVETKQAKALDFETREIAGQLLKDYGLETPVSYIHATINHPGSVVTSLQEDAYPAAAGTKLLMDIQTQVGVSEGKAAAVKQALSEANIKFPQKEGTSVIFAETTADGVAEALNKKGLLPASLATEITQKAEAAHPGQKKIADQISAATAQFVAATQKEQATAIQAAENKNVQPSKSPRSR